MKRQGYGWKRIVTSDLLAWNGNKQMKDMEKKNYKVNQNNIRVKKCCASCIFKNTDENSYTSNVNDKRWCKNKRMTVLKDECCDDWMISQEMDMAGGGDPGQVKKADFIHWFGVEWPKLQAKGWTAQKAREHWEHEHGTSVYMK